MYTASSLSFSSGLVRGVHARERDARKNRLLIVYTACVNNAVGLSLNKKVGQRALKNSIYPYLENWEPGAWTEKQRQRKMLKN